MSAYSDAILATSGLVCYYRCNESSGTAMVDASGVTGNATYSASGVTFGASSILPQDSATCVSFNGTNNTATKTHTASLALTSGITAMAWVQPTTIKTQSIFFKWDHFFLDFGTGATPSVRWLLAGLTNGGIYSPSNSIVANGTYMIAGTFDGTYQRIYINGVIATEYVHPGGSIFTSSSQHLEVGSQGAFFGGGKFMGKFSHASIFNTGLSTAQIQNLYLLGIESGASTTTSTVHSFSKQIIAANPSRTGLTITNNSDVTMYLKLGGTAEVNKGIRLNALGGAWNTKTYTGAVMAIHSGYAGARNVDMVEV